MIIAEGVSKRFDDVLALDHVSAGIQDRSVFGLIGTNGAGKSTFLRLLSGILAPDEGRLEIDGEGVFENLAVKQRCFYISDEQYFFRDVPRRSCGITTGSIIRVLIRRAGDS